MKHFIISSVLASLILSACSAKNPQDATISVLAKKTVHLDEPALKPLKRENTTEFYREFLEISPRNDMYGDAMRRLADLELQTALDKSTSGNQREMRKAKKKIEVAIRLYETFIETYPNRKNNDLILYQLAKAYELDLQQEKMLETLNSIVQHYPHTKYMEEVQFRRGETYFVTGKYNQAEFAYAEILNHYPTSAYYEKSLYKYGWTRFKQLDYPGATHAFIRFLDNKYHQEKLLNDGFSPEISRSEKELLADVLRVTSLSFSYLQGHSSVAKYFAQHGGKPYESVIYNNLAMLYLEKSRIRDAAETYLAYSQKYPASSIAPKYHSKAIDSYKQGGFASLVLPAKISFVRQYGVNTEYWKKQNNPARESITPLLKQHTKELANHFHAKARKIKLIKTNNNAKKAELTKSFSQSIAQASMWYDLYIKSFPNDNGTENINFLLAESHQDAGQYQNAIYQFEKTAYDYPPHNKQQEAAYAALLLYPAAQKYFNGSVKKQWQQKKISSALKYAEYFPLDKNTPSILASTANELFESGDYIRAINTANKINVNSKTDPALLISALLVTGHSEFELQHYSKAEDAYKILLQKIKKNHKEYKNINDRLAASIYKQGEIAKSSNKLAIAAEFFLRVGKEVPASKLRATADYDAATIYISLESWQKAQSILEGFRKQYPENHELQFGVTEKLALVYTKYGAPLKAANEMITLSKNAKHYTREQRRELLWEAATIYNDNNKKNTASQILTAYITNYPAPLEPAIEARQLLADFNDKTNYKQHYYWLREIIKADNRGGKARTKRTQYLAATAYMKLTLPLFKAYKSAKLTIPLKRSLNTKKELMQQVVKSYDNAMKYRVAEITTSATYYIAEIYNDFAAALLKSQRPKKLNPDELDQYNALLEEQAFPFEEKAIDIHAANAERVKDNIYDDWVKLSISALSKLNPVRYAKTEQREPYVE